MCKNYTWHSRTEGSRVLYIETRRRHRSYYSPRSKLADISTPHGRKLHDLYLHILMYRRLNACSCRSRPLAPLDHALFRRGLSRPPSFLAGVGGYSRGSNGPHATRSPIPGPLAHYYWLRNNERRCHQFARIRSFEVSCFSVRSAGCSCR
jgi:hypothetical protein